MQERDLKQTLQSLPAGEGGRRSGATAAGPPTILQADSRGGNPAKRRVVVPSGEASAVLDPVQDASRRLRRCPRAGILDSVCARRCADRQVGTKEWPFRSDKGMTNHALAICELA